MDVFERPPPTEAEQRELEKRELGRAAFVDGRYDEALNLFQGSALDQALRWLREEGYSAVRPPGNLAPHELMVALALSGQRLLAELGDDAPIKVSAACWLFDAIADFRLSLERPVESTPNAAAMLMAEMVSRGILIGQVDMIMTAVQLGWIDKLAELEVLKQQRRLGAQKTNAKRASVRETALAEALAIARRNPTLSNEDLAVKVRDSLRLDTTVKTMTTWVRQWRRQQWLPERRL